MAEDSRQPSLLADTDDLSERNTLLFDVTNSQAYKAGTLHVLVLTTLLFWLAAVHFAT